MSPPNVKSPDDADAEVGSRIRIQRIEIKMSQTALAAELGVSFQQVQKYEKGTNRVSSGRLTKIAHVLSVPVTALFGLETGKGTGKDNRVDLDELQLLGVWGAIRLLRAYKKISDERSRKSIVRIVERIIAGSSKT